MTDIFVIYHEDPTGYHGSGITGIVGYCRSREAAEAACARLDYETAPCHHCTEKHRRHRHAPLIELLESRPSQPSQEPVQYKTLGAVPPAQLSGPINLIDR